MEKLKQDALSIPEYTKLPTDAILFDAKNPRLGGSSTTSQKKLQRILLEEPHFALDLVESFLENGYIEYEPLVVRKSGKRYVVIEGNRRLAAVKHILSNPRKYPADIIAQLQNVPVLVFQKKSESQFKDIRTYLGVHHLQGFREWPAESKAIFLDQNITSKTDIKKLKSEFGIESSEIRRFLIPYRVRKKAEDILEDINIADDEYFWRLGEALSRSDIKEYIQLEVDKSLDVQSFDNTKFRYLIEFIYGSSSGFRRITDTRQLSRLAKVLANKRASKQLENGSTLEEAEYYISTPEETIDGILKEIQIKLRRIIKLKPTVEQVRRMAMDFDTFSKTVKTRK